MTEPMQTGRGYPLPHPDNLMRDDADPAAGDVMRLRDTIQRISADVDALDAGVSALAGRVKTGAADAAPGYLDDKLAAGTNIALVPVTDGAGTARLRIDVTAGGAAVAQSDPLYLASGNSVTLTGRSVLGVAEQIAGQTFNLTYNTEADYAQGDAAKTDHASGGFQLQSSDQPSVEPVELAYTVTASSTYANTSASHAVLSDGNPSTGWGSGVNTGASLTLVFAFSTLTEVSVQSGNVDNGSWITRNYLAMVVIEANVNGSWVVIGSYDQTTLPVSGWTTLSVATVKTDMLRMSVTSGWFSLAGVRIVGIPSTAVDPFTKVLIHADGANGSSEVVDARGITPFGTHCAYFDGSAYFTVPASYKLAFGSVQDFTYELWERSTVFGADQVILDCRTADVQVALHLSRTAMNRYGILVNGNLTLSANVFATEAWRHLAVVRRGGVLKLYVNGSEELSVADANSYGAAPMRIGANYSVAAGGVVGWMDELRVSKVARYTGAFTPHTTPHVRDADTVHLFHFDDGHGSMFIRDDARTGHPIALLNNAKISNAQAKFGSTSLSLGGASDSAVVGLLRGHNDIDVGSDDFTVDCWVRPAPAATQQTLIYLGYDAYVPQIVLKANGTVAAAISTTGNSWNIDNGGTGFATWTANMWQHIAMTRSGTDIRIFINGAVVKTYTGVVGSITVNTSSQRHRIGSDVAGVSVVGHIDEFRMKRGVAEWTSNFTPPAAPYTADDRTVLLLHFEGTNNDKVTLDSSESSYAANDVGDATTPVLVFTSGASLSSTYSRGGHGTSLSFAANTDKALLTYARPRAGHPIHLGAAGEYFCVEAWVRAVGENNKVFLSIINNRGSNAPLYLQWMTGSGNIGASYEHTAGMQVGLTGAAVTSGNWYHVALVREARGYVLYVNGTATAPPANPERNIYWPSETMYLVLGNYRADSNTAYASASQIDSVRITHGKPRYTANFTPGNLTQDDDTALLWVFDGSVGQKWVKELSKNTAMIASTNARTVSDGVYITPGTAAISTSAPKFGTSKISFLANYSQEFVLPASFADLTGDFTIEGWSHYLSSGYLASQHTGTASTSGFIIFVDNNRLIYMDLWSGGTSYRVTSSNGDISDSAPTPTHFAFVKSGTSFLCFINGILRNTTTSVPAMNGSVADLCIGSHYDGSSPFGGSLDELRISNVARWTSNFTPPTIPYGTRYVAGPATVATTNTSRIDLSAFSSIDNAVVSQDTPPGTAIKWLVSFDGRATWEAFNGSVWSTVPLDAAAVMASGMTASQLITAIKAWAPSDGTTLDLAFAMSTSNPSYTPRVDNVQVTMDEYVTLQAGVDYTVRRKKAKGAQTITLTRVRAGNANHVIDYI